MGVHNHPDNREEMPLMSTMAFKENTLIRELIDISDLADIRM